MRVHIIGIGGTFMAGVALIAQQMGFEVSGCDECLYPPMSDVLSRANISVIEGYDNVLFSPQQYDVVVVGNAISRGNAALEHVLNLGVHYLSGPEFLARYVLCDKHVIAIAGTHGKTTTTAMLSWVLSQAGLNPGYLIGGSANNFTASASLTDSSFFVIEADEYDTAFFDKRPKFMHYRPHTLVLNNLEFDHADIYQDLEAIQQQFEYLLRCVPADGIVISNQEDSHVQAVLERGCWSGQASFGLQQGDWTARLVRADASAFDLYFQGENIGTVEWGCIGDYNVKNALAVSAAAYSLGVRPSMIVQALGLFAGVKCRMETLGVLNQVTFTRDFAHHPTAIRSAIAAVRAGLSAGRLIVILKLGSRTLQRHVDPALLAQSLQQADQVLLLSSDEVEWDVKSLNPYFSSTLFLVEGQDVLLDEWLKTLLPHDHVLMLSNKDLTSIYIQAQQLLALA